MAVKFGFAMSVSDIDAGISANGKAFKTAQERSHMIGVSILANLQKCGDWPTAVRQAQALVESLGNGSRRNAMRDWLIGNGGFVWNAELKTLGRGTLAHKDIGVKAAKDKAWWDYTPETDYIPLDWDKSLAAFIKKADKDIENLKGNSKVDVVLLEKLKQLRDSKPQSVAPTKEKGKKQSVASKRNATPTNVVDMPETAAA